MVLNPGGANQETGTVRDLGSIILEQPTRNDHRAGEMVAVIPREKVADPAPAAAMPAAPVTSSPAPRVIAPPSAPTSPSGSGSKAPPGSSGVLGVQAEADAPKLSAVKLAKRRFSRRTGTKLSFKLDRAARVTVTLKRKVKGRRKGKSCSTKAKRGRRCTAYAQAKSTRIRAKKGRTRIKYGKKLRRGTYTAQVSVSGGRRVTLRFVVR